MAEVEWDSKTVIGSKSAKPKVAKNTSDINGELATTSIEPLLTFRLSCAYQPDFHPNVL